MPTGFTLYVQVIIDISQEALDRAFTYGVPEPLLEQVSPGVLVNVPFGKGNSLRKGYVISLSKESAFAPEKVKPISGVLTGEETTEGKLIALAHWMRSRYGSTMIQALKVVLPLQGKVRTPLEKVLVREVSQEEIQKALDKTPKGYLARRRALEALLLKERVEVSSLSLSPAVLSYLSEAHLARVEERELLRNPVASYAQEKTSPPPLTQPQRVALEEIHREWQEGQGRPVLLAGVTGSGKTAVYMELIEETIKRGQQAIVLVPEIALTYQTVRRFTARFGEVVSVISSQLSAGERYDQFRRARSGEVQVMVGPRSALFSPFTSLGLIVIDEEHESSYQSESSPRYDAREAALFRAREEGARLLLGSATPSLDSYYKAREGEYCLVRLLGRFQEKPLPPVQIVDMRKELKEGNRSVLSRPLYEAMYECMAEGHQAMLFLNRRGLSSCVTCRNCGEAVKCPHCDVSLSEHNGRILVCHYCGYTIPALEKCPSCGSNQVMGFRAGTQQIEKEVQKLFPRSRLLRMDFDTTRKKGSYEEILGAFGRGEADILIGTQMIVKGHDFPNVTVVGALSADMSLHSGDYEGAERTFQLLAQAAGRAGRGEAPGKVFFQTFQPEHTCIRAAAAQDYELFSAEELAYRSLLGYPPVGHLLVILGAGAEEEFLGTAMGYLRSYVLRILKGREGASPAPDAFGRERKTPRVQVVGPAPYGVGKIKDVYHKALYVKYPKEGTLIALRGKIEKYVEINEGFKRLQIQYALY